MMKTIRVKLTRHPYSIHVGPRTLAKLPGLVKKLKIGSDALIVTTPILKSLFGEKLKKTLREAGLGCLFLTIPDSEKSKNAKRAFHLIEKITAFDRNKKLFLIAFGGGVVGDLTGFVAAIYKRGIPYLQVPTTLLAQIDSSIGGKTAIDTAFGKNLVGAFYQPRLVLSDTTLLETLPLKQLRSGLAEGVKYALIKDKLLFSFLRKNYKKILRHDGAALSFLILRCAAIKAAVVAQDEYDRKDKRIILNFGHTFGHAIEAASRYKISHGEAVSLGMVCAARLSRDLGILAAGVFEKIVRLLKNIGIPTRLPPIKTQDILKMIAYDKKFKRGKNRFVLLKEIGRTIVREDIAQAAIRKAVEKTSVNAE